MKRIISSLLLLSMTFSLVACGGSTENNTGNNSTTTKNESAEETGGNWSIGAPVDEFGDVVEGGQLYIQTEFSGDFSNTATSSSELKGYLFMSQANKGLFDIYFNLLEYGDTPAVYYESDVNEGIVLRTKINETVREYYLIGNPPNGALMIDVGDGSFYDDLANNDGEMKCVIYIGSSQYNFTIQTGNIKEVSEQAFGILQDGINTMEQAIGAFFNENMHAERYEYIMAHMGEYPIAEDAELNEMFNNKCWVSLNIEEHSIDTVWVYKYENGLKYTLLYLVDGESEYVDKDKSAPYVIQDNKKYSVKKSTGEILTDTPEEYIKLCEGYYIQKCISSYSGEPYYNLYIECDESGNIIHEYTE